MRPAALALNYSVENIRNDVTPEKYQFDSLVWGSLTLAPMTSKIFRTTTVHVPEQNSRDLESCSLCTAARTGH